MPTLNRYLQVKGNYMFYKIEMEEGCVDAVYVQAYDWFEADNLVREIPEIFGRPVEMPEEEEAYTKVETAEECDYPVFSAGFFARMGDERMAEGEARKK